MIDSIQGPVWSRARGAEERRRRLEKRKQANDQAGETDTDQVAELVHDSTQDSGGRDD